MITLHSRPLLKRKLSPLYAGYLSRVWVHRLCSVAGGTRNPNRCEETLKKWESKMKRLLLRWEYSVYFVSQPLQGGYKHIFSHFSFYYIQNWNKLTCYV